VPGARAEEAVVEADADSDGHGEGRRRQALVRVQIRDPRREEEVEREPDQQHRDQALQRGAVDLLDQDRAQCGADQGAGDREGCAARSGPCA